MYRFMARHDINPPDFSEVLAKMAWENEVEVEILRPMLFFHEGQKGININKLREFFTDNAISRFKGDGFIKLPEDE